MPIVPLNTQTRFSGFRVVSHLSAKHKDSDYAEANNYQQDMVAHFMRQKGVSGATPFTEEAPDGSIYHCVALNDDEGPHSDLISALLTLAKVQDTELSKQKPQRVLPPEFHRLLGETLEAVFPKALSVALASTAPRDIEHIDTQA